MYSFIYLSIYWGFELMTSSPARVEMACASARDSRASASETCNSSCRYRYGLISQNVFMNQSDKGNSPIKLSA